MADVFLSYSQKDSQRARQVADALQLAGWDVWWDVNLSAGARFRDELANQLRAAKCVVVLWSRNSVKSDFVPDEAEEGKRRGVLVQAILDDVQPPLGFGGIQWANLISFTGDADFAGMTDLITGIARHVPRRDMGREPFNSPSGRPAGKSPRAAVRQPRQNAKKKSPTKSEVLAPQVENISRKMGVAEGAPREITNSVTIPYMKRTQPSPVGKVGAYILFFLAMVIGVSLMVWLIPSSAPSYVFYIAFAVVLGLLLLVAGMLRPWLGD